jgi:hypothetical protein
MSPIDPTSPEAVQIKVFEKDDHWNIGPSILRYNGKIYLTWTDEENEPGRRYQTLRIAQLQNPYTIVMGTSNIITTPTEQWEKYGASDTSPEVVEGTTIVYGDNGEIYNVYSASGYWTDYYSLALLTLTGNDPLKSSSWTKSAQPILKQGNGVYGPGHASFTTSPDGKTRYAVYHVWPNANRSGSRAVYIDDYTIGANGPNLGGVPDSPTTIKSIQVNPMSVAEKVSGFSSAPTVAPGNNTPVTTKPGNDTAAPGNDTAAPGKDTAAPGKVTTAPGSDTEAPGTTPNTGVGSPFIWVGIACAALLVAAGVVVYRRMHI